MVYATQVSGRLQLSSPILNISMPHISSSPSRVPSSFSLGVSTPNVGKRSPVKLLVCDRGRFTPLICDMGGPRGDRLRGYGCCWLVVCKFEWSGFSSTRSEGKSNSCCLSAMSKAKPNGLIIHIWYIKYTSHSAQRSINMQMPAHIFNNPKCIVYFWAQRFGLVFFFAHATIANCLCIRWDLFKF